MNTSSLTAVEREKLALLYAMAFERGDLEAIEQVLGRAMYDVELDQMLAEVNATYAAEQAETLQANHTQRVRQLLREHIPSAFSDEEELPPLTVGDVVAKMQAEAAQRGATRKEILEITKQLQSNAMSLPSPLRLSDVKRLLKQLGVSTNTQFEKLFQDAATLLSMGRGQSLMAATRRQKSASKTRPPEKRR